MCVKTLVLASVCGAVFSCAGFGVDKETLIEVDAGSYNRCNTPVSVDLPEALRSVQALRLVDLDDNRPVGVQIEPGSPPRAVWIIRNQLPAGHVRRYRLIPMKHGSVTGTGVVTENDGKSLFVRIGKLTVLRYNEAVVPSSIPGKPQYQRSGYIHPVYDPAGRAITDDMAPDHAHQHGYNRWSGFRRFRRSITA